MPIAEKQSAFLFPSNTFCVCSYHFIYHSSIKNDTRINELVKLLSVTDENSEIYKVNHHQERDIKLSEDTKNVVLFALQMAEKTNGALEPTIYPVLREWGFTTGKYQIPDEIKIRDLLNYVDYRKVSLKENQI